MVRLTLVLALAIQLVACGTPAGERLERDNGTIEVGMTAADLRAAIGDPDMEGHGAAACRFADRFYNVRPDRETDEWVWYREKETVVVYLHRGVVSNVGTLPR